MFEMSHRMNTKFIDIFCEIEKLNKQTRSHCYMYTSLYFQREVRKETALLEVYLYVVPLERWDGVMWTGLVWLRIGTGGELL
jgi:hypothetical protein